MYLGYKSGQLFILIFDIGFYISADKLIYNMIHLLINMQAEIIRKKH